MLGAIVFALALTQATSAEPACDPDGSTIALNACARQDLDIEQARMEHYLAAAREATRRGDLSSAEYGGPPTQQVAYLTASQAAWTAYAEITCAGVHDQYAGGSIRTLMHLGCLRQMTHERTQVIWRDHLTYADSTPPVLPEPVEPASGPLPEPVWP
jgi:uncharacterized protein YecT (DUF1311 family)